MVQILEVELHALDFAVLLEHVLHEVEDLPWVEHVGLALQFAAIHQICVLEIIYQEHGKFDLNVNHFDKLSSFFG